MRVMREMSGTVYIVCESIWLIKGKMTHNHCNPVGWLLAQAKHYCVHPWCWDGTNNPVDDVKTHEVAPYCDMLQNCERTVNTKLRWSQCQIAWWYNTDYTDKVVVENNSTIFAYSQLKMEIIKIWSAFSESKVIFSTLFVITFLVRRSHSLGFQCDHKCLQPNASWQCNHCHLLHLTFLKSIGMYSDDKNNNGLKRIKVYN